MRFRLAPSPTGFLHVGNLLNFSLTAELAKNYGAEIGLRVDDIDVARMRPQYINDIFEKIQDLGIKLNFGPLTASDLADSYSQTLKISQYKSALAAFTALSPEIFTCSCSRNELQDRRCIQNCKSKNGSEARGGIVRFASSVGDEVLWRREDIPAYLLTDLVDDVQLGVTHIVRGSDLLEQTKIQRELRTALGLAQPIHAFHSLVVRAGQKISKSQGTERLELTEPIVEWISQTTERLLPDLQQQIANPNQSMSDLPLISID